MLSNISGYDSWHILKMSMKFPSGKAAGSHLKFFVSLLLSYTCRDIGSKYPYSTLESATIDIALGLFH